jgi:hypothetical protein
MARGTAVVGRLTGRTRTVWAGGDPIVHHRREFTIMTTHPNQEE